MGGKEVRCVYHTQHVQQDKGNEETLNVEPRLPIYNVSDSKQSFLLMVTLETSRIAVTEVEKKFLLPYVDIILYYHDVMIRLLTSI